MVLLSFDIEEFDMPFEYNGEISFEEQIDISQKGTTIILDLLKKHSIKSTFFSTVIFAENSPEIIQRILKEGHELASHTYFHSKFSNEDLLRSREKLEELSGSKVVGLRMPRMSEVDEEEVYKAGYHYNSSMNPTYLPGRYNNLHLPRTYYEEKNVLQIPATVTPKFRIPLFWLSFHNFPLSFYKRLFEAAYVQDQYVNIYFHPWEFMNIKKKEFKLPFYTTNNTGKDMVDKFDRFLQWINDKGYPTQTIKEFSELR